MREKSLLWKLIQIPIFKVQNQWKFVREWIFWYLSFWESFLNENGKWLQCERERMKMCVYTSLSFSFSFLWEYTSLSISRGEDILDIYFKGWVRVEWKKVDIWSQLTWHWRAKTARFYLRENIRSGAGVKPVFYASQSDHAT